VVKRIGADRCAAVLIDVQDFFLSQLEPRAQLRISPEHLLCLGYLSRVLFSKATSGAPSQTF
jgi:hypothetical protein